MNGRKLIKSTQKVYEANSQTPKQEEKILVIHLKKGWKKGTKLTFPKEADAQPGMTAGTYIEAYNSLH